MSVDLWATLARPVTLGTLVHHAHRTLTMLLSIASVPDLVIVADRRYERGTPIAPGHRLERADLDRITIGRAPADGWWCCDIAGNTLWLYDHTNECADSPAAELRISPSRSAIGVTAATALALAAAELSGGTFIDEEIRMLRPGSTDPGHVLAVTRLPPSDDDFLAACRRYVGQFPGLNGWPLS